MCEPSKVDITDDHGNEVSVPAQGTSRPDEFGNTTEDQREDDLARAARLLAEAQARMQAERDAVLAVMS